MNITTLRPATIPERKYTYTQSSQIGSQTGNLGHLRADMDRSGEAFFSTWWDCRSDLKTEEFKEEFDDLINGLREDGQPLHNRTTLSKYCYAHPEAANEDFREFFFRAESENYAYMFRLNPNRGEYNVYCYTFIKEWLDKHIKEAEREIRFIDSSYRDLFRLRDGGTVRVTFPDGEVKERICRYIDSTHFEFGSGPLSIFHIAEFAGWIEGANAKVEPVT